MKYVTSTCYHCDADATGKEHVPPKSLFPTGKDWNKLITVPSCRLHNDTTSTADDYLKFLLGAICLNVPDAIRSSVARGAVRMVRKKSRTLSRYGFSMDGETLNIDETIPLDIELLATSLKKMARALYFRQHNGRRKLLGTLFACPLFIPIDISADPTVDLEFAKAVDTIRRRTASDFNTHGKCGDHPEIFAYQVLEGPGAVFVNMEFYGEQRASVMAYLGPLKHQEELLMTLATV
jgi:hypothetical protein